MRGLVFGLLVLGCADETGPILDARPAAEAVNPECRIIDSPTYQSCKAAAFRCGVVEQSGIFIFCEERGGNCDGAGAACSDAAAP